MATEIKPAKTPAQIASASRSQKVVQYVDQQLEKTRRQVKSFDLIASFVGLGAFLVGFFLVAAIIDAWIWPLGVVGRMVALAVLVIGALGYTGMTIVPLIFRRINPDYAARMIEESKPSFKNSLLNYLALRREPKAAHKAVYNAVASRAATELSTVPEDSTVDRSNLIRTGFILVAVMVLAVAYMILSPKNPLQTIGRILAPTSKIAQPAVVQISDVQPGDTKVFFGDRLTVTAKISGQHDEQDVKIVFSTDDGQIIDSEIQMKAEAASRYVGELATDGSGIQQALSYQVVARDGVSPKYKVKVLPNPTIAVKSVRLVPLEYTKLPERTIEGQGDIQTLEGTNITINAVANLPIKVAWIELLNSRKSNQIDATGDEYSVVQTIEMSGENNSAHGDFRALLTAKRDGPLFTHYRIRFKSENDDRNTRPNVYPVRITPDLAPEIKILEPIAKELSIPVNQKLKIDIQANDLDFEISSVDLHIDHKGTLVMDRELRLQTMQGKRRVSARYELDPTALNLKPGDVAIFHAKASDNRTSHYSGGLDPNISYTEKYTLNITEAVADGNSPTPAEKNPEEKEDAGEEENGSQDEQPNETGSKGTQEQNKPPENKGEDSKGETEQDSGKGNDVADSNPEESKGQDGSGSDEKNQDNKDGSSGGNRGEGQQDSNSKPSKSGNNGSSNDQSDGSKENSEQGSNSENPTETQSDTQQQNDGSKQDNRSGDETSNSEDNNNEQESAGGAQKSDDPSANQQSTNSQKGNRSEAGTDSQRGGDNPTGQGQKEEGSSANSQSGLNESGDRKDSGNSSSEESRDQNLTEGDRSAADKTDGATIERLKKYLEEKEKNNNEKSDGSPNDENPGDPKSDEPESSDPKSSDPKSDDPKSGDPKSGDPKSGDPKSGDPKSGDPKSGDPKSGDPKSGDPKSGDPKSGDPKSGDPKSGDPKSGDPKSGDPKSGDPKSGDPKSGDPKSGDPKSGDPKSGDPKSGDPKSGDPKSGDPKSGDPKSGDPKSGDPKSGDPKSGDPKSGDPKSGDPKSGDPKSGDPKSGDPKSGDPKSGDPKSGDPKSGDPKSGDPKSGDPKSGDPKSGDPKSGDPKSGDPKSGDPKSGGSKGSDGASSSESKGSSQKSKSASGDPSGSETNRGGGGQGGGATPDMELPPEEANLEFTKETVDMILEKLESQRLNPDQELLDEIEWTKDDFQNFLDRWTEMKKRADAGDVRATKRYENKLRSLGLQPKSGTAESLNTKRDKQFGLSEDGALNFAPNKIQDDIKTFLRERSRVRER